MLLVIWIINLSLRSICKTSSFVWGNHTNWWKLIASSKDAIHLGPVSPWTFLDFDFRYILTILSLSEVVLVKLTLGYTPCIIKQLFGKCLIFTFDSVVFLLSYCDIKRSWTNWSTLSARHCESSRWTCTKLGKGKVSSHGRWLFGHLSHSSWCWNNTWPFSTLYLDKFI